MAYPLMATVIPLRMEAAASSAVDLVFKPSSSSQRGVKPANSSSSVGWKLGISRMTQVLFM